MKYYIVSKHEPALTERVILILKAFGIVNHQDYDKDHVLFFDKMHDSKPNYLVAQYYEKGTIQAYDICEV